MKLFHILSVLLLALSLWSGCDEDVFTAVPSELVVEGWIESDGFPVVMLSRTLPISTERQATTDLSDYVVRWAKVSITDGQDTVVLTGKVDRSYFPPFIYTTTRMRGKAGKTYRLMIENGDEVATAETTIPAPPTIDSLRIQPCSGIDTLYRISLCFTDRPEKDYYQLFVRVGRSQKQFLASYMGCYDDVLFDGATEIPVYKGHHRNDVDYTPYYQATDTVVIKFCHVDEWGFNFWKEYNRSRGSGDNALLCTSNNLPTNIEGGYGYWIGYGLAQKVVYMKKELEERP